MQNSGQFRLRNGGFRVTYRDGWVADVLCAIFRVPIKQGQMSEFNSENTLLNFYRASELHGGLILGQVVRRAIDPRVIQTLTRHSAEELMHAQLLTEAIVAIGGTPAPVRNTWQALYAEAVGAPGTMLEVLAMMQTVGRRVHRHFTIHLGVAGIHPAVAATLRRISNDERAHLSWIKAWLDRQSKAHGHHVSEVLRRYELADQRVNERFCSEYRLKGAA